MRWMGTNCKRATHPCSRVYLGDYIRRGNLLDSLVAATIFGASRSFVIAACTFSSTAINFERVKDLLNGSFRPEAVIQA